MKNRFNPQNDNYEKSTDYFLLDAELYPLLEEAENDCLYSQMVLTDAFCKGKSAKKDLDMKGYLLKKIYANTDNNLYKMIALWDLALIERDKGNYELMKKKFHDVVDFMQKNMPMKKWDFELFAMMEEFIQLRE